MKKFIATLLTFVLTVSLPCLSLKANFYEDNTYQVIDEFDYDYDIDCNDDLIEVVELDDKEVALLKQKFSAQCESVEVYSRSWSMYGSNYCYSQMNDVEKEFYNRLDEITMHYMNSAEDAVFLYDNSYIRGVDYGDLSLERERAIEIAKIYMYQNPQYYFISKWIYAPKSQSIIYLGCLSEFVDGSERLSMTNEIFAKIDSWMLEVDEIPSEYGKALKIHDILCENVDYKLNEYDQSIYSVVILGETRCGGYAPREFMRHFLLCFEHAHISEHLVYSRVYLLSLFPSCCLQHEREVLIDSAVVKELEVLEDYSHLPSESRHVFPFYFLYVPS